MVFCFETDTDCNVEDVKYCGEWKGSQKNGIGLLVCGVDGYQFECEWRDDIPLGTLLIYPLFYTNSSDEENSIHPEVRKCIAKGLCTRSVTGEGFGFPQFLTECETCDKWFCPNCSLSHHTCASQNETRREWCWGFCDCNHHSCVQWKEVPPKRKRIHSK